MPTYNLIESSDAYLKTPGNLWKYYRNEPALDANDNIIDFPADNKSNISLKSKQKIIIQTGNGGTKDVKIRVPLKYLSNFWRTIEIPLINCEISIQLKWSKNYFLVAGTGSIRIWF